MLRDTMSKQKQPAQARMWEFFQVDNLVVSLTTWCEQSRGVSYRGKNWETQLLRVRAGMC